GAVGEPHRAPYSDGAGDLGDLLADPLSNGVRRLRSAGGAITLRAEVDPGDGAGGARRDRRLHSIGQLAPRHPFRRRLGQLASTWFLSSALAMAIGGPRAGRLLAQ